jgi:hypothetical protein
MFMESLSNNPLTSAHYSQAKAKGLADSLGRANSTKELEAALSAQRLARASAGQLLNTARKLVLADAKGNKAKDISEEAKLELALGAIGAKDYGLALHMLNELSASKDANIKAAVFNAFGILDLLLDRTPEAVEWWKKSLGVNKNYKPAAYNLGFLALKFGDLKTGRAAIVDFNEDWFAQGGLFVYDRNQGSKDLDSRCTKFMSERADHPMMVFNCGVYAMQNKNNSEEAKKQLGKVGNLSRLEKGWDEQSKALLRDLAKQEREEAASKQAASKKAEDNKAAQKAAEEKKAADKPQEAKSSPAPAPAAQPSK